MLNGYKVFWTPNALDELEKTVIYLEHNFSSREIKRLAQRIEEITALISQNPFIFPLSDYKNVRRTPVLKLNTLYYRVNGETIEILSFFSNRQSPQKRKIKI